MKELLSILVVVGGGLGTFLLGMKHLSEGLQAVSGSGLRRFMSLATTHRLAGVGTGIVSTVIVQSSSIITVMVVGFVSSGLLNLTQAINVISGSSIGTTATAWLIAFAPDVNMLGLFVIGMGAAFYFFQRGERLHNIGQNKAKTTPKTERCSAACSISSSDTIRHQTKQNGHNRKD